LFRGKLSEQLSTFKTKTGWGREKGGTPGNYLTAERDWGGWGFVRGSEQTEKGLSFTSTNNGKRGSASRPVGEKRPPLNPGGEKK